MNQRRKPGILAYVIALSCISATAAVACGNGSSGVAAGTTTCSFAGNRCPLGCSPIFGCVQCLSNTDCVGVSGYPICVLGQCSICGVTADCNAGEVCEPATHTCAAACTTNANCAGGGALGGPDAPTCDTTASDPTFGACIGCTAATAATVCTGTHTKCDLNRMQCAVCLSRADCGAATPACDVQNGNCVQCLVDADCTGQTACGADHACHPICLSNTDCATTPARPVCDALGACVECAASTDCAANANNLHTCNTNNHTCVGCTANTDCPTTAPVCRTIGGAGAGAVAQCVQCQTNANCTAALPVCDVATGQCVQCQTNANCTAAGMPAGLPYCDAASGQCEQCRTNADCATATPTCTAGVCG